MDFNYSPEEEKFKKEVEDFFTGQEQLVSGTRDEWNSGLGYGPNSWEILKKIGEKGWLCPTWPREHGGLGASYMYRYIMMEQMHY